MERSGPYRSRKTGKTPHPYSRTNARGKTDSSLQANQSSRSSRGGSIFSRVKSFFFGESKPEDVANTSVMTVPRLMKYTESPVASRSPRKRLSMRETDRSLVSDFGLTPDRSSRSFARDPNIELREFFEEHGDRELSTVEAAGVISLIKDAVSRNESVVDFSNVSGAGGDVSSILGQSHRSLLASASDLSGFDGNANSFSRLASVNSSPRRQYAPQRTPIIAPSISAQHPWHGPRTHRRSLASGPPRTLDSDRSRKLTSPPAAEVSTTRNSEKPATALSASIILASIDAPEEAEAAPVQPPVTRFQPRRAPRPTDSLPSAEFSSQAVANTEKTLDSKSVDTSIKNDVIPQIGTVNTNSSVASTLSTSAAVPRDDLKVVTANVSRPLEEVVKPATFNSAFGATGVSEKPSANGTSSFTSSQQNDAIEVDTMGSSMDTDDDDFVLRVPESTSQAQALSQADREYLESLKSEFEF